MVYKDRNQIIELNKNTVQWFIFTSCTLIQKYITYRFVTNLILIIIYYLDLHIIALILALI